MGNCFSSDGGGGGHHTGVGGGVAGGPSPGGIPRLPDTAPVGGISLNAEAMMPLAQLGGHGRPSMDLGSSSRPLPDPASDATPSSVKVGRKLNSS
jgi:hypothetical protein